MAAEAVPAVVMQCICEVQAAHASRQRTVLNADNQVIVRLHEAIRDTVPASAPRRLRETPEELEPVDIVSIESRGGPHAMRVDVEKAGGSVS
jgi:hypothetical protein